MHIHCLGLNHKTADVSLREKLALSEDQIHAALARLGCGDDLNPGRVTEMVILSTCNRVELYAVAPQPAFEPLERFLANISSVRKEDLHPFLYRHQDEEAVDHLLHVAAGLDSMVLGEPQILGQVADAFSMARTQGTVGKLMTKLFHTAIHAGKRAHAETKISHNPASVSSQAVVLVSQIVTDLADSHVLILGAGEMAELAVEGLRKRGVRKFTVVNRTVNRAHALARRWGGEALTFEDLFQALQQADVLISSTGAPHTLIGRSKVEEVISRRADRPLVILDIAVPRDIEADVGDLPGVTLFDIDEIHERLKGSLAHREKEIPAVEAILEEERNAFEKFMDSLDVIPLISKLHRYCDEIRREELARTTDRLSYVDSEELEILDAMTEAMLKKFLHSPIKRLKQEAGGADVVEFTSITKALFGFEGEDGEGGKDQDGVHG